MIQNCEDALAKTQYVKSLNSDKEMRRHKANDRLSTPNL